MEHLYLLIPLACAILFCCGSVLMKRSMQDGVTHWQVTLFANLAMAILYQALWWIAPIKPNIAYLSYLSYIEPTLCAFVFMAGQASTFMAFHRGDISIATPVLATKVLFVAFFSLLLLGNVFKTIWFLAAAISVIALLLISSGGKTDAQKSRLFTIFAALVGAISFAAWDVLMRKWTPLYGAGFFIPVSFAILGVISLVAYPFVHTGTYPTPKNGGKWLLGGSLIFALQSLGMALSVGVFTDPTIVNVVYNTRAIWGILLAALLSKLAWSADQSSHPAILARRLVGAALLLISITLILPPLKNTSSNTHTPPAPPAPPCSHTDTIPPSPTLHT